MSNRGRHKKKTKIDYIKIQKLINDWNSELLSIEELNDYLKQIICKTIHDESWKTQKRNTYAQNNTRMEYITIRFYTKR